MFGRMIGRIERYLTTLRFPILMLLTVVLFTVNMLIPDVVPFVDEVLMALIAIVLSRIKRRPASDEKNPGSGNSESG